MRGLFVLLAVALLSQASHGNENFFKTLGRRNLRQLSECPVKDCNKNFWNSYMKDQAKCDDYLKEADSCYGKIQNDICQCDTDMALEANAWKEFLSDVYNAEYCAKTECSNKDTQDCLDAVDQAAMLSYTVTSGDEATADQKDTVNKAIECAEKHQQTTLDLSGCGWGIYTLESDSGWYIPLWKAWKDGCDVNSHIQPCMRYLMDFETAICVDGKFEEFGKCAIEEFSKNSKCSSFPKESEQLKQYVFGTTIEQRCPVYNEVMSCDGTHNKREPMKRLLELLKELKKKEDLFQ